MWGEAPDEGLLHLLHRILRYFRSLRERRIVANSHCFDPSWYLDQYPDVRASGQSALTHYLSFGAHEGRSPHPLFDVAWYLQRNPDAARSDEPALSHYLRVGAARGASPNVLFEPAFYTRQVPSGIPVGVTPFAHYLTVGEAAGLRPHPLFDPNYYRTTYPDVAGSRMAALTHYRVVGAAERRNPSVEFDANIYWDHLSPEQRAACTDCLAHYREVGHTLRTSFSGAKARERLIENCANGRPTILAVLHDQGGGTEKYVHDIAEMHRARVNMLAMTARPNGIVAISLIEPAAVGKIDLDPITQLGELIDLLRGCRVARLHVNHILGHERHLRVLVEKLKLPFDVTIHDYYLLSPQPHLTGPDGRYVGDDLSAAAEKLLAASFATPRPASLTEWQAAHRWLLDGCARLIVPSNDAARRVAAVSPERRLVVAAHPEGTIPIPALRPARLLDTTALRIAVIGEINPHKGSNVILACAELAKANSEPLQFTVIGIANRETEMLTAGVRVTGRFRHADLPRLLQEADPHLIWYPAQCPETFSYTLSEGLKTGLPLVVTNLGALPERVGGRRWVWIKPWDLAPLRWNDFFKSIRTRNFLPGPAPEITGAPWTITDSFYERDYLTWLDDKAPS